MPRIKRLRKQPHGHVLGEIAGIVLQNLILQCPDLGEIFAFNILVHHYRHAADQVISFQRKDFALGERRHGLRVLRVEQQAQRPIARRVKIFATHFRQLHSFV